MKISDRSSNSAQAIFAVLQVTPSEAQVRNVEEVIEQALVNAMLDAGERATGAVMECCSPDLDTAHKVAEEIRRRQSALITNLSSMR